MLTNLRIRIRNYIVRTPVLFSFALKVKSLVDLAYEVPIAFGWMGTCYTPKFKVEAPMLGFGTFKIHDDKIEFYTPWEVITATIYPLKGGQRIRQTAKYGFLLGTLHEGDSEYVIMKRGAGRGAEDIVVTNTRPYLKISSFCSSPATAE